MVLPFRPELLDHEAIGVAERDLLEVALAAPSREEVPRVRVVVGQEVVDLAPHGGQPPPEILAMADQRPVLPLPGRGHGGPGDLVPGQELGQDLGVQAVGLLGALGDHPELLGIGQHNLLGQRFQERHEPEVAGGGLDNHVERPELPEELSDLVGLVAVKRLLSDDG